MPKASPASRPALSNAGPASSGERTTRKPRPPPPWMALIATGQPRPAAKASMSSGPEAGSRVPGTVGTPASAATLRADTLSPIARIAAGGGPTQISPASSTACANVGFSARKP